MCGHLGLRTNSVDKKPKGSIDPREIDTTPGGGGEGAGTTGGRAEGRERLCHECGVGLQLLTQSSGSGFDRDEIDIVGEAGGGSGIAQSINFIAEGRGGLHMVSM